MGYSDQLFGSPPKPPTPNVGDSVMLFRYLLYRLGPEDCNKMYIFGATAAYAYSDWRQRTREALAAWHRRQLRALDHRFDLQEDQFELVRRREAAIAQGIGPSDPRYPDLFDVRPLK